MSKANRKNPTCYFVCEDCGAIQTASTSDVKAVGHPVCPDDCGNEEMSEVTYDEYRAAKKIIDAKPHKDVLGDRYGDDVKYFQPKNAEDLKDKDGRRWQSWQVWLNKDICAALFPNVEIAEYSGAEIEEPEFVDKE